jgi:P4 family phage/plasmid primase-like protien
MRDHDYSPAADFLANFFGETTEHAVEIRGLPNERGAGRAAPLFTRDPQLIEDHCRRWDLPERAIYFGVATRLAGSPDGTRASLAELPALWVDIDTDKLGLDKAAVTAALREKLFLPPSIIINSGGGVHAYWLLKEALDIRLGAAGADNLEHDIVAALKQLAGICAGDTAVCDLARVMRLPGSHNTKIAGELRPVTIIEAHWQRHYEFSDLVEMLDNHRPAIERPVAAAAGNTRPAAAAAPSAEQNPFLVAAARFGIKAPIDVEQRIAEMTYLADGDAGIHQTQLHVSASLVAQGEASDDDIANLLLAATKAAAGHYAANWNWRREERNLRLMIQSARTKFAPVADAAEAPPALAAPAAAPKPAPVVVASAEAQAESASAASAAAGTEAIAATATTVVSLAETRRARRVAGGGGAFGVTESDGGTPSDKRPLVSKIGEAVIEYWLAERGLLISVAGELATYDAQAGCWTIFTPALTHALKVTIQGIMAAGNLAPSTSTLNAVWRYIIERPSLHREEVEWNASGLIVCRNCAVDPNTGERAERSPELYATWSIDVDYDPAAECPRFRRFLQDALEGIPSEEARQAIATVQEHFGASLVPAKPRDLRKAIFFIGKSHTGKSRIANIYRALKGGAARCVGLKVADLEDQFGLAPFLHTSAWVADDAVRQGVDMDAERFKVIVTGEPLSVRIAGGKYVEAALDIPVVWTANNLPRVYDDSEAVYNRTLIFPMNRVWPEGAGLDERGREIDQVIIEDELAGVLNWAIAGWKRLKARGKYAPPSCMQKAILEFKESNNPIATWMAIAVERAARSMVDRRDLRASYNGWCTAEFGADGKPIGGRKLFSAMRTIIPEIGDKKDDALRFLTGIKLTEEGIAYHKSFADLNFGKPVGSGAEGSRMNKSYDPPAVATRPGGDPFADGGSPHSPPRPRAPRF